MNKDLTCYDDADLENFTEVERSELLVRQFKAQTKALQPEPLAVINPRYPGRIRFQYGEK